MAKNKPTARYMHVYKVERLKNSVNGNPRYEFSTDLGIFHTESDGAFNYDVENVFGLGVVNSPAIITLNYGKIIDAKKRSE